jgi:hypothetical protein
MFVPVDQVSGGKKTAVDWTALSENQDDMIDHKYLPAGFRFRDPSKMKKTHYQALLEHWYERQEDENTDIVFAFKGYWDLANEAVTISGGKGSSRRKKSKRSTGMRQAASGLTRPGAKGPIVKVKGTKKRPGPPGLRVGDLEAPFGLRDIEEDDDGEEEEEDAQEDGEIEAEEEGSDDGEDDDGDENVRRKPGIQSKVPPMTLPFSAQRVRGVGVSKSTRPFTSKPKRTASSKPKNRHGSRSAFQAPSNAAAPPASLPVSEKARQPRYPSRLPCPGQSERPVTRSGGKRKVGDAGLETTGTYPTKKAKKDSRVQRKR